MKRNEMLQIIQKYGIQVSEHPSFRLDIWANCLLQAIENAGMLPPPTVKVTEYDFYDMPVKHQVNEWESENV